jgi:hypothetical protein
MTEKLKIERYKLAHGKQHCDIFLDGLDIATVYEEEYLHLLAAAPLMLEALERMIKYIEAGAGATAEIEYGAVLNQARAAIAAAKGE